MTDKIIDLIIKSDLSPITKSMAKGFVERSVDQVNEKNKIRKIIEGESEDSRTYISDIVYYSDEVIIYTASGNSDWDKKYPFRSIFLNKKGEWEKTNVVSYNFETAFLVYLQYKHLGANSQFVDFARKMLEIPNPE